MRRASGSMAVPVHAYFFVGTLNRPDQRAGLIGEDELVIGADKFASIRLNKPDGRTGLHVDS